MGLYDILIHVYMYTVSDWTTNVVFTIMTNVFISSNSLLFIYSENTQNPFIRLTPYPF